MGSKYERDQIIEVLCEFQFVPGRQWDMTIPGLMFNKIKANFPHREEKLGYDVGLEKKDQGFQQKIQMVPRMQFFNTGKSALVQVSKELLTINHLAPYPHWEQFKPMILENLAKYHEIANPGGFNQISLRYINKFEWQGRVDLKDYFTYFPSVPKSLPQTWGSVGMRIDMPYEDFRDQLKLTLADTIPASDEDKIGVILDLDYKLQKPEKITVEQIGTWLELAHDKIVTAFEACITDKTRSDFLKGGK